MTTWRCLPEHHLLSFLPFTTSCSSFRCCQGLLLSTSNKAVRNVIHHTSASCIIRVCTRTVTANFNETCLTTVFHLTLPSDISCCTFSLLPSLHPYFPHFIISALNPVCLTYVLLSFLYSTVPLSILTWPSSPPSSSSVTILMVFLSLSSHTVVYYFKLCHKCFLLYYFQLITHRSFYCPNQLWLSFLIFPFTSLNSPLLHAARHLDQCLVRWGFCHWSPARRTRPPELTVPQEALLCQVFPTSAQLPW